MQTVNKISNAYYNAIAYVFYYYIRPLKRKFKRTTLCKFIVIVKNIYGEANADITDNLI